MLRYRVRNSNQTNESRYKHKLQEEDSVIDLKIFTVHLLCAKHRSKPEDETASKGNMIHALEDSGGLPFVMTWTRDSLE